MTDDKVKIQRALISVSDKTGIIDFAKELAAQGVELISTGGTSKALTAAGLKVFDVSDITGFPEMLDGRVKTLHPVVHGGLLSLRDNPEHMETIAKHNIKPIDLVCVNLYPFEATIAKPDVELDDVIENIDIGGPSMIRSASKNYRSVTVIVSPSRYADVIKELKETKGFTTFKLRQELAIEAFGHTARYDATIHEYLHGHLSENKWPSIFTLSGIKLQEMRYGENPHQPAAFYKDKNSSLPTITNGKQLQGKELSYNNIMDADAALVLVKEFTKPAVAIIKHTNACGTAVGKDAADAFVRAFEADPLSAFGGIVAVNRPVDEPTAKIILEKLGFFEIILAPSYDGGALGLFGARKNLRVMSVEGLGAHFGNVLGYHLRRVEGGFLVQEFDRVVEDKSLYKVVTKKQPDPKLMEDMDFGWRLVKHIKSNAIVLVKDGISIGVGAGQMNRVGSLEIAIKQAGIRPRAA